MEAAAKRAPIIISLSVWAIINIALMALLIISGDWQDINNWIEVALWALSIPALLSGKK